MTLTSCILLGRINRRVFPPLTVSPRDSILPSFGNIHAKPYDQTGSGAKGKEERESFPVVPRAIDDGLNDVRADHTGSSIRETEQAEELEGVGTGHLDGVDGMRDSLTMLSKPGGLSSAIIVWEKA